jgi:tRNA dimethylallyltransferase
LKPGDETSEVAAATDPTAPFYIVGPTGSGKSAIAVALAERCRGEIVNADAYQLYEGLDIVSAKPPTEDLARVPHHLFGCIPPDQSVDAARFEGLGREAIAAIAARGRLALVVGGSGLYVKTLTHGLSPLPPSEPALRSELDAKSDSELIRKLQELDPVGAATTNLKNRRYVIRALEITLLGGRPMSEQKNAWQADSPSYRGILIQRDRAELYERINARTLQMFDAGLIDEVGSLGGLSGTAEKAIGIREVRRHLAGEIDLPTCIGSIQQASRRFAKRQMSWFRRESQFTSICIGADDDADSATARILAAFPDL